MRLLTLLLVFALTLHGFANELWREVNADALGDSAVAPIQPQRFKAYRLDIEALEHQLSDAPQEGATLGLLVELPTPDGALETFSLFESPIMAPELAARFPEIRTFLVRSRSTGSQGRIDVTPQGFHAMIQGPGGTWFIDPYIPQSRDTAISYYKRDYVRADNDFNCLFGDSNDLPQERPVQAPLVPIEGELLTYRCAIACTGEYSTFHGGTVPLVMGAITTALNRVNQVYEVDFAIRMILVANNDQLVFLDANSDPYTNNSGSAMLGQNQTTVTSRIGTANYDIGHVFSTGGGGVASLGVVCNNSAKARGVTGLTSPIGDPFYIDYVAHEMGHQWGGNHTFNSVSGSCGGGNRNGSTAYEPGSGSTVMAYAGICSPQNLQPNSDPFFHAVSYDEIVDYSRNDTGGTCGTPLVVNNQAPTVEAGNNYTIPSQTPFELTGSATDPDGDTLTYCWEQFDLGPAGAFNSDPGSGPLFRSWNPTTDPTRTFPRLSNLLSNTVPVGEFLPTTTRTMTFRVTVRDNHTGGGGVDFDTMSISVSSAAGPFQVTAPNTAVTWNGNATETVTWNVASTTAAPVNATTVDILFSSDGGLTFPTVLASDVPNDGSQDVTVPNVDTTQARIKVIGHNNIFFDLSNQNFTVVMQSLACPSAWNNWQAATAGVFIDANGNGVVDIIDLLGCL